MGYRLEFWNADNKDDHIDESGGKLFGYISDSDLRSCKSWQWLKAHGAFKGEENIEEDVYEVLWDYGFSHKMTLDHDDFNEFIALYVEDRNRNMGFDFDSLENYEHVRSIPRVTIEWF